MRSTKLAKTAQNDWRVVEQTSSGNAVAITIFLVCVSLIAFYFNYLKHVMTQISTSVRKTMEVAVY